MNDDVKLAMFKLFVRGMLRSMEQRDDADNDKLVTQIAHNIILSMALWTHQDSPLKRDDHENAYL